MQQHGVPEEGYVAILLAHAQALHATGAIEAARLAIAEAKKVVLAAADKIQDDTWRASFLEAVPENAEAIALAREWQ